MIRAIFHIVGPCAVFSLICAAAQAQTPTRPDAGVLQQQIERERPLKPLAQRVAPDQPAALAAMKPHTISVTAKQFRFVGNTLLKSEGPAAAVAGYLPPPLAFAQLQAAAAAVAASYRQVGWIVLAYLPAQEITADTLTIQIVEAVFSGVRLEGQEAARVDSAQVLELISAQQNTGASLNADQLDRALLIADDLPGVSVVGVLAEGSRQGEAALLVKLADEPLVTAEATTDNAGSRSTGRNRLSANPMHTEGSDYLRLAASLPVGSEGWRVSASASQLHYRLMTPEVAALGGRGTADILGFDTNYPLIRSRLTKLYFNTNIDSKHYDNQSSSAPTSRHQSQTITPGLSGNRYDAGDGGGANSASLARQQELTNEVSLYTAAAAQRAHKNLDSSEKFFLGGMNGVRAYPSSEARGGEGELLNEELRWRPPEGVTLTAFHDRGQAQVSKDNNLAAAAPNVITLKGHGLSAAWQAAHGVQRKASWARREGANPNPTAAGLDQEPDPRPLLAHRGHGVLRPVP